jgi:hypothetical protein
MLVESASLPGMAAPIPPMPNANQKNIPEIKPMRSGTSSCAYTSMAENAEEMTKPITTLKTPVQ